MSLGFSLLHVMIFDSVLILTSNYYGYMRCTKEREGKKTLPLETEEEQLGVLWRPSCEVDSDACFDPGISFLCPFDLWFDDDLALRTLCYISSSSSVDLTLAYAHYSASLSPLLLLPRCMLLSCLFIFVDDVFSRMNLLGSEKFVAL